MREGALAPYETALTTSEPLAFVAPDGRVVPLAIDRYLSVADAVDATVIQRCAGPVLDVGCGPGRIVHALVEKGIPALGVDIAAVAVSLTVRRGAPALIRSVFDRVPGEGRWPTVLVLDGNIGIGGDAPGLLRRLAGLVESGGSIIAESSGSPPGTDEVVAVRFAHRAGQVGPLFRWAFVDLEALTRHARSVGLSATEVWSSGAREFVRLQRHTAAR
jgi:SAM-dependent methyltransferase